MNLSDKETVKEILKEKSFRPSKKFGQNFLIDEKTTDKIIEFSQITKEDIVIEIGPGLGVLTSKLAQFSKKLIAVEKDKKLVKILKSRFANNSKVKFLEKDILKLSINSLLDGLTIKRYKVVANLPYNIALPVIRKFIEAEQPPEEMVLMLQKEVGQKICSKKSSLPKIAIEFYSQATLLFNVPKELFWPQPKVDGAVIKISHIQKNIPDVNKELFFKILKAGFSSPRKTILNNLSRQLDIEKEKLRKILLNCNIPPKKRGHELDFDSWVRLSNSFSDLNMLK